MLGTRLTGLVGVSGFAGSGKDTIANYLVERYGYQKTSLADPIKRACREIFGFSDETLWGPSQMREALDPRYPFSGRSPSDGFQLTEISKSDQEWWLDPRSGQKYPKYLNARICLQTLGTEFGRRLDSDLWIKSCLRYIENSGTPFWVIPDVRFRNEMEHIRASGGVLIRVCREGQRSLHQSEQEMADIPDSSFHFVIQNFGSLSSLYDKVDSTMVAVRTIHIGKS